MLKKQDFPNQTGLWLRIEARAHEINYPPDLELGGGSALKSGAYFGADVKYPSKVLYIFPGAELNMREEDGFGK